MKKFLQLLLFALQFLAIFGLDEGMNIYSLLFPCVIIIIIPILGSCRKINVVEYAYLTSSLSGVDHPGANCRQYCGINNITSHPPTASYTHCSGSPLKLSDSQVGSSNNYTADQSLYHCSGGALKILFVFSERVQLSHIRLHIYNNWDKPINGSYKSLAPTVFSLMNDEYEVWEPEYPGVHIYGPHSIVDDHIIGPRNITVSASRGIKTRKVALTTSQHSSYQFCISEIEFYTCTPECEHLI